MGLDSVELLMDVERYFNIAIPNEEAEQITTVQEMTDCVARHLKTDSTENILFDNVVEKLRKAFAHSDLVFPSEDPSSKKIADYLDPGDKTIWAKLEKDIALVIPKPELQTKPNNTWKSRFRSLVTMNPMYEWSEISIWNFISSICICNMEKLIDRHHIRNWFEIYIAVGGITVERIGVDCYEIAPEKSFTNDLGVD